MSTATLSPSAPVVLVCRDRDGRELSRQTFTDPAKAERVMIARNRAEMAMPAPRWARCPLPSDTGARWGIETEIPAEVTP